MGAGATLALAACLISPQAIRGQGSPIEGALVEVSGSTGGAAIQSALVSRMSAAAHGVVLQTDFGRTRLVHGSTVRVVDTATLRTGRSLEWRSAFIDLGASTWTEGLRPAHFGAFAEARWPWRASSTLSASVARVPIWRSTARADPLRALRVRDLRRLDRRLAATEARISLSANDGDLQVEAGATRYGDGNRRMFVGASVELPLVDERAWVVTLAPNAYAEAAARSTHGFLTPTRYARAGLAARFTLRLGRVSVAGSSNPHLYHRVTGTGLGLDGRVVGSVPVRGGSVDLSAEFMRQDDYRFIQLSFGVRGAAF